MNNKDLDKRTIPFSKLALYGLGGMFPNGWILFINGYYMMIFFTDILQLPTVLAASIYSAIQWWKLVAMLLSGVIVDGIQLKSGKYRGWVRIALIAEAILFPIAYADFGLKPTAAAVVVIIAQALLMLGYNLSWTGIRTLPAAMAKSSYDITLLTASSAVGGSLANIIWGFASVAMLSVPLWKGTSNQYCGVASICSLIMVAGAFIMFKLAEPYDGQVKEKEKKEKITGKKLLENLKGPMIPYFISATLSAAQAGFFSTLLSYYSTYVLKNPAVTATVLAMQSGISLVGNFISPSIARHFRKKSIHIFSQFFNAACYVILGFFGTSAAVFIGLRAIMSLMGTLHGVVGYSFPIDIGDYNEMHGIDASRAILVSLGGSTTRLGNALSTTVASFGLAAIGYVKGMEFDDAMCRKLIGLMAIGPGAVALLSGIAMFFYKVDEREINEYRAKKAAAAEEAKQNQ